MTSTPPARAPNVRRAGQIMDADPFNVAHDDPRHRDGGQMSVDSREYDAHHRGWITRAWKGSTTQG